MQQKYKKRVLGLKILSGVLFLLTIVIMISGNKDITGLLLNGMFLATMIGMIGFAEKRGIKVLHSYTMELQDIAHRVDKIMNDESSDKNLCIEKIRKYIEELKDEEITERFRQFETDYKRTDVSCKILDYINYDELTEKLPMRFCQILPSLLTSMGILGTFLGLILGLPQINFTNVNTMGSSIQSFVSGVNIAFFSSLYGITFSMYMNYFYNYAEEHFEEKLVLLDNKFEYYDLNRTEQSVMAVLLEEEKKQTQNQEKMNLEFGKTLATELAKELVPAFNDTNTRIQNLLSKNQEMQREQLKKMADMFLESLGRITQQNANAMNESVQRLNNSFEVLKESTTHLGQWQHSLTEELERFINETLQIGQQMKDVSQQLEQSNQRYNDGFAQYSRSMDSLIRKYEAIVTSVEKTVSNHNNRTAEFYEQEEILLKDLQEIINTQKSMSEGWETTTKLYAESLEVLKQQSEEAKLQKDQIAEQGEYLAARQMILESMINTLSEHVQSLIAEWSKDHKLTEALKLVQDIDSNVEEIKGQLTGIGEELEVQKENGVQIGTQIEENIVYMNTDIQERLDVLGRRVERAIKDITLMEKIRKALGNKDEE